MYDWHYWMLIGVLLLNMYVTAHCVSVLSKQLYEIQQALSKR
jgi:hypothetical protein